MLLVTIVTPLAMKIGGLSLEYRFEVFRKQILGAFLSAFKALGFARLSRKLRRGGLMSMKKATRGSPFSMRCTPY
ncbi:hypothetical protein E8F20_13540 [Pseudomonas sp. BN415]|uniref:hypothetical protein n=1 Tax=Pseudomonas sp. BN415 TaxID=2567889 RepID=UPI002457EA24|nr:hypothetical protein [Pseudomonas sp. BN415]MDH4582882.1 hypothetical protein [Pseudomonas sp. BN415]